MTRSAKYQLLQVRLGRDLKDYVAERAKDGTGTRPIARDLTSITGIPVSYEALRNWFPELFAVPARRRSA